MNNQKSLQQKTKYTAVGLRASQGRKSQLVFLMSGETPTAVLIMEV